MLSPNIVRVNNFPRLRWVEHLVSMGKGGRAFKFLTGKPTGKRALERPKRRWKNNIRIYLKEIGVITRNWIYWLTGIVGEPL